MRQLSALALAALCAALLLITPASRARPLPGAPHCAIFPADNPWNQRVDRLPVAQNSQQLIDNIGPNSPLYGGFASGMWNGAPVGYPINVVSNRTQRVKVRLDPAYRPVSYQGAIPLPARVRVQGGNVLSGDRHLIVVNRDTCRDYEFWRAFPLGNGGWSAENSVVFNLRSDLLRPVGWTSANAAGLPILPGLVRYDEVAHGAIDHALWFTAPLTRAAYVYPARHYGQGTDNPALPPMGTRVRLKASVDISHLPYQARVVALALKRYGMMLSDNGMPWYIGGAPSPRWKNMQLRQLARLTGSDFEVVDTSSLPHPGL
jgi:hypothetical protein